MLPISFRLQNVDIPPKYHSKGSDGSERDGAGQAGTVDKGTMDVLTDTEYSSVVQSECIKQLITF